MKISVHAMVVGSFVPMLESLSKILDKAKAHAAAGDLLSQRLAPDMYTLAQQVRLACGHARDGTARLLGHEPAGPLDDDNTIDGLQSRIAATNDWLKKASPESFAGAEERDCSVPLPGGRRIEMDGLKFLMAWVLPHFYFHLVTAYDILRHKGVPLGKQDYLSQVGAFIRPIG